MATDELSVIEQADRMPENFMAEIMRLTLEHRNHDQRAVSRFEAAVNAERGRILQKTSALAAQGVHVTSVNGEIADIASRAIARAKRAGNVLAYEPAA